MIGKRIYKVTNGQKSWLVKAVNMHVAIGWVVREEFKVNVASQDDLVAALKQGLEVVEVIQGKA
jgi:hypothetical protein